MHIFTAGDLKKNNNLVLHQLVSSWNTSVTNGVFPNFSFLHASVLLEQWSAVIVTCTDGSYYKFLFNSQELRVHLNCLCMVSRNDQTWAGTLQKWMISHPWLTAPWNSWVCQEHLGGWNLSTGHVVANRFEELCGWPPSWKPYVGDGFPKKRLPVSSVKR